MILLIAVIAGLIIGLALGGKLSGLASLPLRHRWFFIVAFALQSYAIWVVGGARGSWTLEAAVLVGSYVLLLAVLVTNWRVAGIKLIAAGLFLNLLVIAGNGGFMPVTLETMNQAHLGFLVDGQGPGARVLRSKDVVLPKDSTNLWILSDIFAVADPFPRPSVFSIGDVLIAMGAGLLVARGTLLSRRQESTTHKRRGSLVSDEPGNAAGATTN